MIPSAQLTPSDVLWSYTGVRPLPYSPAGPTSDISRRHVVHHHTADPVPVRGLLSVVGGKLTTFRSLAQDVTDDVLGKTVGGRLGRRRQRSTTTTTRLPGAQTRDFNAFRQRYRATSALPPEVADRLLSLYGTRAVEVEGLIGLEPDLIRPIEGVPGLTAAEVVFALRTEAAVTLSDLVARRIMTGVGGDLGRDSLVQVAEVAAAEVGWSDSRVADEVSAYLTYIQKLNPRARPPVSRTAADAALG